MKKTTENELEKKLIDVMDKISIGSLWVHYKKPDNKYQVVAIGLNEETKEPSIIYVAQYGAKLVWIRTYDNFTQEIELNGEKVLRFQKA